jgi:hypothetical protein
MADRIRLGRVRTNRVLGPARLMSAGDLQIVARLLAIYNGLGAARTLGRREYLYDEFGSVSTRFPSGSG